MTTTDTTRKEKLKRIYEVIGGYYYETEYGGYTEDVVICMIGDILYWMDKEHKLFFTYKEENSPLTLGADKVVNLWKDKRNPIEEQSKECVDFIYSLISQGQTQTK